MAWRGLLHSSEAHCLDSAGLVLHVLKKSYHSNSQTHSVLDILYHPK